MADTAPGNTGVVRARRAVERSAWDEACQAYAEIDPAVLDADDLERWATACYLRGDVDDALEHLTLAHQHLSTRDDREGAMRLGFWIIFVHLHRGEVAQASGWWSRCEEELTGLPSESAAAGWFACLAGYRLAAMEHRFIDAGRVGEQVVATARRHDEPDMLALGLNICGRAAVRDGRPESGLPRLDEAMLVLLGGGVSPIITGTVYCSVIEACEEIMDLRRAHEWTHALARWCAQQRRMLTFSGRCLIHRSAIALGEGDWDEAGGLAAEACRTLRGAADQRSTGRARYLLGECARLTGRDDVAEVEYRSAADWGHDPQPGLALLRLRQGRHADATSAIRRLLGDVRLHVARAPVLVAAVEILLTVGEIDEAANAADELEAIAERFATTALRALADRAVAEVGCARSDRDAAADSGMVMTRLRRACDGFRTLPAPYESARTRLLIAGELERAGDRDTAEIEREGARRTLTHLGAVPDLDEEGRRGGENDAGLSRRELEVLSLVATGATNQAIADELCIAVRTVDRHVENILRKLDVPSRTAATAVAYEHQLL